MNHHGRAMHLLQQSVGGLYTPRRLALLLIISVLFYALLVNDSWRVSPDSALYMTLGRSMAQGHGYQYNHQPHTIVPPGYPLLLAGLMKLGDSFMHLRAAHALLGWSCALLAFLALRRLYGNDVGFLALLFFAVSHSLVARSAYFLSDVPFTLAVWLTVYLAACAGQARRRRWLWALALLPPLALCCLIRINGLGIPPAVALYLAWAWRDGRWRGWLPAALVLASLAVPVGWMAWAEGVEAAGRQTYLGEAITNYNPLDLARIYLGIILRYPRAIAEAVLGFGDIPPGLDWAIVALIALGAAAEFRRGRPLLPLLVLIQMAGLCLSAPGERYVLPILPAFYLLAFVGIAWLVSRLKAWRDSRRPTRPPLQVGTVRKRQWLIIICAVLLAVHVGRNGKSIWQARTAVPGGAETADKQYLFDASRRLLNLAAKTGRPVVLSDQPRVVHFLTDLPVIDAALLSRPTAAEERPDYLLIEGAEKFTDPVRQWLNERRLAAQPVDRWLIKEKRRRDGTAEQQFFVLSKVVPADP